MDLDPYGSGGPGFGSGSATLVKLLEKIRRLIFFWDRFRLSLPGRRSIIKKLLTPQSNYLGCILCPSKDILNAIQELLDSYALNGLQVRIIERYLKPKRGARAV
jgi:hypothetical protein